MSPDKSTTDPVELTRRSFEAGSRRDIDAAMSNYGSDSVWDMSAMGLGSYRGLAAIRSFFEDWIGAYDEFEMDLR
jgi:ketosteroid isomerase-like protein